MNRFLRYAPERRLAWFLGAAALLWLLPGTTGVYAALGAVALLLILAAVDAVLLPSRRAITLSRNISPSVGIGDQVEGAYQLASSWPRALELDIQDRVAHGVSGGVDRTSLSLPRNGTAHVPFSVTGTKRGVAQLGSVGLRASSQLGLVGVRHTYPLDDEILVTPSVSGVRRFRLLAMQHRLDSFGIRELRRKGEGQGFAGLRDYVLGDDPRHIDWKATARKARPITREYTIERSQTVLTLIDAGRSMTQLAGDLSRFEHALSAALVLTDVAANAGDRVGTLVFDDVVRAFVPAQRSRGALEAVRNALSPVAASSCEPDYANAFRFLAARQRKRALIVFFTDVIDSRASQALIAHVMRSTSRHLALVVALRNDDVFAAAAPGAVARQEQLFERASAEELLLAREEALMRMRRAGVVVLDVSPRTMAAGVINRYLELKARGAL